MDGVSGAFAVVSLALQLLDSVQEARTFLKDIQNAPKELIRLGETLAQLDSVLGYVSNLLEQQLLTLRLPGTPTFIIGALRDCARRMEPLRTIIHEARVPASQARRMKMAWASTKLASKKEDLQQLERQMRDAISDLQLAITGNLWQLQMHQLETTRANIIEPTESHQSHNAQTGSHRPPNDCEMQTFPQRQRSLVSVTRQETVNAWYRGMLGSVTIRKKMKYSSQRSSLRAFGSKPLAEETSIIIAPSFVKRLLELRLAYSLGKASRTLSFYPVVTSDSPIIDLCCNGDILGLQAVFSSGTMSPSVVDEFGWTLLHHAARCVNVELCAWLLELGVDPDRMTNHGLKAVVEACSPIYESSSGMDRLDTIRLLVQAQEDLSTTDVIQCAKYYRGTPEGASFILSKTRELGNEPARGLPSDSAHIFARAVKLYGAGDEMWEAFIRKMIREGVDIHDRGSVFGTSLDDLFEWTYDAPQAKESADAWLQILSSEGIDVQVYLMREVAIHAAQKSLTWQNSRLEPLRKLCFEMEGTPSVWWEWCPDPCSHVFLAQTEYTHVFQLDMWDLGRYVPVPWQDRWPFDHPEWSDDSRMWRRSGFWEHSREWDRKNLLARERANRRSGNRDRKLRRGQEPRTVSQMPGSWIE